MTAAMAALALAGCDSTPARHRLPPRESAIAPNPAESACLAGLGSRGAGFTPLPDAYTAPGCSTINAVRLYQLGADRSELVVSNLAAVSCPMATAFAAWARYGVDRAARQILGSTVIRIETMGAYSCRNIAGSDRRSAHATGNAVDVSAVVLADGRRVSVAGQWLGGSAEERRFLRVIHASACKRFATVLGPDYNPAHHNHLHLEMGGAVGGFCR